MSNNAAAEFHTTISFFFHIPKMRRKMKDIYYNGPQPLPLPHLVRKGIGACVRNQ
jgi:hypothetical protein